MFKQVKSISGVDTYSDDISLIAFQRTGYTVNAFYWMGIPMKELIVIPSIRHIGWVLDGSFELYRGGTEADIRADYEAQVDDYLYRLFDILNAHFIYKIKI